LHLAEEFARQMIHAEELHAADVDKMLRKPCDVAKFSSGRCPGRFAGAPHFPPAWSSIMPRVMGVITSSS